MDSFWRKIYLGCRLIIFILPFLGLLFLLNKNFVFSGHLTAVYNFQKSNPIISPLSPPGRVLKIEKDGPYYIQKMVINPVYFSLFLPTKFRRVKLSFLYWRPAGKEIKVGGQLKMGGWHYYLKKLPCQPLGNGWCAGSVDFSFNRLLERQKKVKFMISAPWLASSTQPIIFAQIKAALTK